MIAMSIDEAVRNALDHLQSGQVTLDDCYQSGGLNVVIRHELVNNEVRSWISCRLESVCGV